MTPDRSDDMTPERGADATPEPPDCSCSEARAHLEAFLDQECSQDLTHRLAQHVAACDHCSRLADAQTHLRAILRSRCAEEAPPELRARVLGRLSLIRAASATGDTSVASVTGVTSVTSTVRDSVTTSASITSVSASRATGVAARVVETRSAATGLVGGSVMWQDYRRSTPPGGAVL
ncbi:mycothiol system anti-sigma-R factor [Actinomyces sp. 2119]|uniref:mycothiol system anti-sigma-R factor n=1 Tax=Actinomyces sp. 2119 TaxID=2321393 RepID=UPI000E6C8A13|nr:mycothiol system anti-sigma-R factor [Actinomyces sp. 2119]